MDLITFHLSREQCAIELACIEEVISLGSITTVPTAPAAILGAINVRGRIVSLVDLDLLIDHQPSTPRAGDLALLVHLEEYRAALVVRKIDQVCAYDGPRVSPSSNQIASRFDLPTRDSLNWIDLRSLFRQLLDEISATAALDLEPTS